MIKIPSIPGTRLSVDPRLPTTSAPLARVSKSLSEKYKSITSRMPDRGGFRPMGGIRSLLPNGSLGGIPQKPLPLLNGIQQGPIPKANTATIAGVLLSVRQKVNENRLALKPSVRVLPGLSALLVAKAPRIRSDMRGTLYRSGLHDVREPQTRGQFAQHRTVPASTLTKIAVKKVNMEIRNTALKEVSGDYSYSTEKELPPIPSGELDKIGQDYPLVRGTKDSGKMLVKASPDNQRVTVGMGEDNNTERMFFLAVVAVIGFMIVRR